MNLEPVTLYIRDNTNSVRFWSIDVRDWDIWISHGVVGGAIQEHKEEVLAGKAGRSRKEQVMLYVASHIKKKRDAGYSHDPKDAEKRPVNALKLPKPMLAKKQDDINMKTLVGKEIFIQYKYDGHRCLVANKGGVLIAYSRNGKPIDTIGHILNTIDIPEGIVLDGELYCHGYPLQSIASWVKRKQKFTEKLDYHIYDVMIKSPYRDRLSFLSKLSEGVAGRVVPTRRESFPNLTLLSEAVSVGLTEARAKGYEGLIVRHSDRVYEDGKRSFGLIKVKAWHDSEFLILDVKPSADGWGVLVCKCGEDTFDASAPGTIEEKKLILERKNDYIGRMVKVQYACRTLDGLPSQPIALCII